MQHFTETACSALLTLFISQNAVNLGVSKSFRNSAHSVLFEPHYRDGGSQGR